MTLVKSKEVNTSKQAAAEILSLFRIRLQHLSPFFTHLAYRIEFKPLFETDEVAYTNGRAIYYNVSYFSQISKKEQCGIFLHEILHVVLSHVLRRGYRNPVLWNIACDIYVNNIITELPYCELPENAVLEPTLWRETVEEIYNLLLQNTAIFDGEKYLEEDGETAKPGTLLGDLKQHGSGKDESGTPQDSPPGDSALSEEQWNQIVKAAAEQQQTKSARFGQVPQRLKRLIEGWLAPPKIDWREALREFLIKYPCDFTEYDRRELAKGNYIGDCLGGERLRVAVCVDTSGSISQSDLELFTAEIAGILNAYSHVLCNFYWADCKLYGPYSISDMAQMPDYEGGGGTSFVPFFEELESSSEEPPAAAIYLTDGYGTFPPKVPDLPTLWVVLPDGLEESKFPFGTVAELKV